MYACPILVKMGIMSKQLLVTLLQAPGAAAQRSPSVIRILGTKSELELVDGNVANLDCASIVTIPGVDVLRHKALQ